MAATMSHAPATAPPWSRICASAAFVVMPPLLWLLALAWDWVLGPLHWWWRLWLPGIH